jgi:cytochrome c oxidase subunit 2
MVGRVVVMEPSEYQAWLTHGNAGRRPPPRAPSSSDARRATPATRATARRARPSSTNIYGTDVALLGGATVKSTTTTSARASSIPQAKVTAGYQPIMPTFKGQISEDQLMQLITYVKSLSPKK